MQENLQWQALEYEDRERSSDWFWALGVIIITSSIAAIIFGDYFFAALLLISGVLLGFFAKRPPEYVTYELNAKGLKIRSRLFPYENIKSFWVQTGAKPMLFIFSGRFFIPIISIPIENNLAEEIHSILTINNIKEKEMKEHPSETIMDSLGF